jgi:hypothetical protein
MVTPDEVEQDLQEEVEEECSKYGSVERVIIYQVLVLFDGFLVEQNILILARLKLLRFY